MTSAELVARAAIIEGKYAHAFPSFGPERRGAPLTASTRVSDTPIRTFSQIEKADISVVLDPSLFSAVDILGTLKPGGLIVINTTQRPEEVDLQGHLRIATLDAAAIALRFHLIKEGAPIVNTPMLGAFSKASGIVSLDFLEKGLKWKLAGGVAATNIAALRAAYEEAAIRKIGTDT